MMINEATLRAIVRQEIVRSSTRASLSESRLLQEGAKESVMNVVQAAAAATVEYGLMAGTAGFGSLGPAEAAETAVDVAFSAESVISNLNSVSSLATGGESIGALLEKSKSLGKTFLQSKDLFYKTVKSILEKIVRLGGRYILDAIEKIKEEIEDLISRFTDTIGDSLKIAIPDAVLGNTIALGVAEVLESLGENCYDAFAAAIGKAGAYAKYFTDPDAATKAFDEMYPKTIKLVRDVSDKVGSPKGKTIAAFMYPIVGYVGASALASSLEMTADFLEKHEPQAREAVRLVVEVGFPVMATLMAAMQVILRGELTPDSSSKEDAAEAPKTESRRRDYLRALAEEISSVERDHKKLLVQDEELEELGGYDVDRPAIPGGSGSHDDGYEVGSVYEDDDTFKKIRLARLKASGVSPEKAKKMAGSKLKHRGQRAGRG